MKFERLKLSELCISMHQGINTVADNLEYQNEGVPIIQSKHITSGFLDLFNTKFLTREKYDFYKQKYNPVIGDILICNIGTIGKSIVIEEEKEFLIAWNLFLLRLDRKKIIPKYANCYFEYLNKRNYYDKYLTGGTVKFINKKVMGEVSVFLPSINHQIHIANILSKAEGLIQQRKETIALLDEYLKSTFLEMFGDPVRNEKGWEVQNLDKICEFENGDRSSNYPSGDDIVDEGIIFINSANIVDFKFKPNNPNFITQSKYNSLRSGKCKMGDLIFTLRGNGLGKCCVFESEYEEGFVNAQIVIIRPNNHIINRFLIEQFRFPSMFQNIWKLGSGSAQPQLSVSQLKKLQTVIPPIEKQTKYIELVNHTEVIREKCKESLRELENLYGSLSQNAFRGDLIPIINFEEILPENKEEIRRHPSLINSDLKKMVFESSTNYSAEFKDENKTGREIISDIPDKNRALKSKITWEGVSIEMVSNWLKENYRDYHFTCEMAIRFLTKEYLVFVNYFSSEDLKKNPKTNEQDDFKSLIFSALRNEIQFLKVEQFFYDAEKENFPLKLKEEDREVLKNKSIQEKSQIYFRIIE